MIGGGVALFFQKFMIILFTSFSGSFEIVSLIATQLIPDFDKIENPSDLTDTLGSQLLYYVLGGVVLGLVGMLVQYLVTAKGMTKAKV